MNRLGRTGSAGLWRTSGCHDFRHPVRGLDGRVFTMTMSNVSSDHAPRHQAIGAIMAIRPSFVPWRRSLSNLSVGRGWSNCPAVIGRRTAGQQGTPGGSGPRSAWLVGVSSHRRRERGSFVSQKLRGRRVHRRRSARADASAAFQTIVSKTKTQPRSRASTAWASSRTSTRCGRVSRWSVFTCWPSALFFWLVLGPTTPMGRGSTRSGATGRAARCRGVNRQNKVDVASMSSPEASAGVAGVLLTARSRGHPLPSVPRSATASAASFRAIDPGSSREVQKIWATIIAV